MAALHHFAANTDELAENDQVTAALCFPRIFEDAECDAVIAMGGDRMRYLSAQASPIEGYRSAGTLWMEPSSENAWLHERLSEVMEKVNRRFRFDIRGFRGPLLLCRYREDDGFEWHLDTGIGDCSTRKLSLSIQLSSPDDYEGGGLEFMPQGEIPFSRTRGSVIAFPSFLCHRVTRLTGGERWSLVTWGHGPSYR